MNDLIMAGGNLENIVNRLDCCVAVLSSIATSMANGDVCADAVSGACDLLECICRDFRAYIDSAEEAG